MAEGSFQDKTEKATPKKREQLRQEGQVVRSVEIAAVLVLLAAMMAIYAFSHFFYSQLLGVMQQSLSFDATPGLGQQDAVTLFRRCLIRFGVIVMPVCAAVFMLALAANFLQVGFHLSAKALEPKLGKLDVIKGLGRLFSVKSLVELVKSLLKLSVIGLVSYGVVQGQLGELSQLYAMQTAQIFLYLLKTTFKLTIWVALTMSVIAVLDYAFQKWQFEKDNMMTKQEVKDELKQSEGDPQVKSRIRSIQQQAARRRMMQALPDADVVVTNPTHLAVAIQYDPLAMRAPQVVAKGAGQVAEKIKSTARDYHIPVVENKKLARNLYKLVDVGGEIPSDLYRAVAELLAYVYRLKGKTA